jgi:proline racemase
MAASRVLTSIDAHAAGAPLRLLTSGLESPGGGTLALKARALERAHAADFQALVREPRGFEAMTLGMLCEPASTDADAAVLFRRAHGFVPLPVAGLVAATTIVLERGLLAPRHEGLVRWETGAGLLDVTAARITPDEGIVLVRCAMPPSFVLAGGVPVAVGQRAVPVDVAWGGPFFAIVDSEAAAVPLVPARVPELRRLARAIADELARTLAFVHPAAQGLGGLGAVVFTGPADRPEAQLRGLAVSPDGFADRAPSGAALAAILAVFQAMGLAGDEPFVMEGLAGTTLSAQVTGETHVGELPAIRVSVEGRAWITGEHRWLIAADDPLGEGFDW